MIDFKQQMEKSYPVPSQISIMAGSEPIDIRQVCDTVNDFEIFKEQTGTELRYSGLITFEKSTKIFKGCIEENGSFSWVNLNMEHQNEIGQMNKALDDLQERMSSFIVEFEENIRMMNLEF